MTYPLIRAALPALLLIAACDGGGGKGGTDTTEETDPSTETDATMDSEEPVDTELTFPEDTVQLRIMNLTGSDVSLTGTDADGAAVDISIPSLTFTTHYSLPVGTGVLSFDFEGASNQIDLTNAPDGARALAVIGQVSGFTGALVSLEPTRTIGSKTLAFGTTGRTITMYTEAGTLEIPGGEAGEILNFTHTVDNSVADVGWLTYGKPFAFNMARIEDDSVGYIINSDISSEGFGTYYFVTQAGGPVQVLKSDVSVYAYSADPSLSGPVTFTATTPFGTLPIATVNAAYATDALPFARIPADSTEITITAGATTVTSPIDFGDNEIGIAVAYPQDDATEVDVLLGEPNDRRSSDAYLILKNFTSFNAQARCYHAFAPSVAPGGTIGGHLVAPRAVLNVSSTQTCNLSLATPPAETSGTPTHTYGMPTSTLTGYHVGFLGEPDPGDVWVHWAYRRTDDANVYMSRVSVGQAL